MSNSIAHEVPRRATSTGKEDFHKIGFIADVEPCPSFSDEQTTILIIDRRALYRECLASSLIGRRANWVAVTAASVADWRNTAPTQDPAVILLCIGNNGTIDVQEQLTLLSEAEHRPPVALLSEAEDLETLVGTFGQAVRGYIPSNATLDVVIQALDLIKLGGVFVSASCLSSFRHMLTGRGILSAGARTLTAREHAVLAALRQGRSNKTIAYDLDLSESTVKVHVRNIMKKLKAHNRTEVAFLTRSMCSVHETESSHGASGSEGKIKTGEHRERQDQEGEEPEKGMSADDWLVSNALAGRRGSAGS
jgi:DNA-binding NarL/FixJ family response regulator